MLCPLALGKCVALLPLSGCESLLSQASSDTTLVEVRVGVAVGKQKPPGSWMVMKVQSLLWYPAIMAGGEGTSLLSGDKILTPCLTLLDTSMVLGEAVGCRSRAGNGRCLEAPLTFSGLS